MKPRPKNARQTAGRCWLAVQALAAFTVTCGAGRVARAQSIQTIAGRVGSDDGRPATQAAVAPAVVALDPAGNVYFSESFYNRVRKVSAATGIVSTVAGTGLTGFSGDGGPATAAPLSTPAGIAVDGSGNLYICDNGNNRVRRVDAGTGTITTLAGNGTRATTGDGGPATAAALGGPRRLAVDTAGNVYIAEATGRRVRKVLAASGKILTVAGDGSTRPFSGDGGPATGAPLRNPRGIAVDSAGNLFIADTSFNRVRMVAAATGIITTVAGNGTRDYSGDGSFATAASLGPFDVAVDASGNLLIADYYNNRIRKVTKGIISTAVGTGRSGFSGDSGPATAAALNRPGSVATSADGGLLISDSVNYRIRAVNGGTGTISTIAGRGIGDGGPATAAIINLAGIALDRAGNLLIADTLNNRIRRVSLSTGLISTIAGTGSEAFEGDGGPATEAAFDYPWGVATDSANNVYVSDQLNHRVRRIDATSGIVSTAAGDGQARYFGDGGPATAASLNYPSGLTVDAFGNVYVADSYNAIVRKLTTGTLSTVAGIPQEYDTTGDGGPATAARLAYPIDVALDASSLFIADADASRIRRVILQNGLIVTYGGSGETGGFGGDGGPVGSALFSGPLGISTDSAGDVLISDTSNNRVRRVDARTGIIRTIAGNGTAGFTGDGGPATAAALNAPLGAAVDAAGNVYISDGYNNRVRVVSACTAVTSPPLAAPANGAVDVGISPALSWSPVPGAFRYDVFLDTSPSPQTLVAPDLTTTSYTTSNLGSGVTYRWRVVAKGDPFCDPVSSAMSEVRSFATSGACAAPGAFDLSSPAAGVTGLPAASVALGWSAAPGASSYDLYLGPSTPPPLLASGLAAPGFVARGLVAGSTYYWNVVAHASCDPAKTTSTSARTFQVAGACSAPGAFALTAPAAGASNVTSSLTLTWAASANAASYDLYLGSSPSPPLYLAGLPGTSEAVSSLTAGATYYWRVVARTSCDASSTASTATQSFSVAGACATPGAPSIVLLPPGNVGSGQTYVIAWSAASGLDAGGAYVVERALSPAFAPILESQTTGATSASFVAVGTGRIYHRVRAVAGCDPSRPGPDSDPRSVNVVNGTPNIVFTIQPSAVVTALGEKLEDKKTTFTLENISAAPVQIFLGRQEIGSVPFFYLVDPTGEDAAIVTLEPRMPKSFEVRFSGPPNDKVASYQGLIFANASGQPLSITPYAFVNLKVGGSETAAPEFRVDGIPAEYAFFPGLAGDDAARPAIAIEIRNPGATPMELGAEIGPEVWLLPEPGWNSTPIEPGASRTVHLFTRRTRAPNGSALPRYTYFTARTRSGQTARLLVQDNDAPPLAPGRTSQLSRGVRSYLIPSVVKGGSKIGNVFVSRIRLSNAGTESVQADLFFTPNGADGFDAGRVERATVVVPPNDLVNITDPLVQLFGLAPPIAGTLEVRTAPEKIGLLTVTSSVDAPARSGGTFGFQMPTAIRGEGARVGSPHYLSGITASAGLRTNLILAETTGIDAAVVKATLYDSQGNRLGDYTTTVPRYGQQQISGATAAIGAGVTSLSAGRIDLDVLSGGGSVVGLVTVIDNSNDDATTYFSHPVNPVAAPALKSRIARRLSWAQATTTQKYLIPAVVNGFQTFPGTDKPYTFRSLLGFSAGTLSPVTFRLTYRDLQSGQTLRKTLTLDGRRTQEYPNVLEQLFGLAPGTKSQGPIFVEMDGNGLMYCKVYSDLDSGTLGDGFPVVPIPAETLTGPATEKPLYLDGLEQSVDHSRGTRSNLILNEVSGQPVTVTVRLYEAGNRSSPMAEKDFALNPLQKLQLSTVFGGMDMESDAFGSERNKDRTNVLCVVTPKGGSGLVSATVTTIDNRTGDTKNALMTPNGGVPATGGTSIGF